MGFVALMAGALFYAARLPVEAPAADAVVETAPEATGDAPVVPDFRLPDLEGVERDIREWRGSHTLLNFWATWCAPCRVEMPLLKEFQDEYGGKGIQVIGIAVDFPEQVAAAAPTESPTRPVR